ncbi:MarR family winged helix-turn-helix transcriptional regulator [Roseibium sp. AS2]|uniref:MarR family winged helix-turn-helix transcriptional regulator n=1 Tax=Roseibium sp. AS2 TaxID=3135781 RepID=UPI003177FC11
MQDDQCQFHGLLHSADLVETELRRKLAPLGIQPRQARILEAMGRTGAISQAELATAFGVTSASMSTMTDRLLAAGYITRTIDPASRRQNVLELTEKGRTLLAGIGEAWSEVDEILREILGEDAVPFFEFSRRLRDRLGGTIPGSRTPRPGASKPD